METQTRPILFADCQYVPIKKRLYKWLMREPTELCSICLENKTYIETECSHTFCNCLIIHFNSNGLNCPMCRQNIQRIHYRKTIKYLYAKVDDEIGWSYVEMRRTKKFDIQFE